MSRATLRPVFSTHPQSSEPKLEKPKKRLKPMAKIAPATRLRKEGTNSSDISAASSAQPAGKASKNPKKPSDRAANTPDEQTNHMNPSPASTSNPRGSSTSEASSIPRSPSIFDLDTGSTITSESTPPSTNSQGKSYASLGSEPGSISPIYHQSESPKAIAPGSLSKAPIGASPGEPSGDPKPKASTKSRKTAATNPRRGGRKLRRLSRGVDTSPVEEDTPGPDATTITNTTLQSILEEGYIYTRPDYSQAPRRSSRLAGLPDFGWIDGRPPTRHPPSPGSAKLEAVRATRRRALEKLKKSRAARSKGKEVKEKPVKPVVIAISNKGPSPKNMEKGEEEKPVAKQPAVGPKKKADPVKGVKSGRVAKRKGSADPSRFFKS